MMEKKLRMLFDYQKFEQNEHLGKLIGETEDRYAQSLSDEELNFVNAAGTTSPYRERHDELDQFFAETGYRNIWNRINNIPAPDMGGINQVLAHNIDAFKDENIWGDGQEGEILIPPVKP